MKAVRISRDFLCFV